MSFSEMYDTVEGLEEAVMAGVDEAKVEEAGLTELRDSYHRLQRVRDFQSRAEAAYYSLGVAHPLKTEAARRCREWAETDANAFALLENAWLDVVVDRLAKKIKEGDENG